MYIFSNVIHNLVYTYDKEGMVYKDFKLSKKSVCKMMNILVLFVSVLLSLSLAEWQDLHCEPGHRYMFSDLRLTWQEAREECQLQGGWLVDLRSRTEQNCLLRYAKTAGVPEDTYWHDGNQ